jgi:5-methylcytosine-specific restriction endonuclease McrA
MHPIKEYDFTGIEKSLALEYIKIHNTILNEIKFIQSVAADTISKNYLNIFTSKFKMLITTNEKLVVETIICATKDNLDDLVKSYLSMDSVEKLKCDRLTGISYYSNLKIRIGELTNKKRKTKAERDKLKRYTIEFNSTIGLKPLLLKVFDYSGRRNKLLKYYAQQDYRVCAYCLAQYTSIYRSSGSGNFYLTGNLDHVKSKSSHPFLSLSINNLIPVCAHCNQRKSDKKFKYDPFNSKHKIHFNFTDCNDVVKSKVVFKGLNNIGFLPLNGDFKDITSKLDLKDLYKNFESNAKALVERYNKFHSKGYGNHLKAITKRPNSREFIEYFISEVPLIEENVLKEPLTKFKMDLYNALKT